MNQIKYVFVYTLINKPALLVHVAINRTFPPNDICINLS